MSQLGNNLRRLFRLSAAASLVLSFVLMLAGERASGQSYVYAAGYCADGSCIPNPANFGYYQTGWRRWPTARPADLHGQPVDRRPVETLPDVEVPDPHEEGEVNPRFRPNRNPQLPPQPELQPQLPPINPLPANPPIEPAPTLPPLDIPQPTEEDQGSSWDYGKESIVARPVELNSLEQIEGGEFLVAARNLQAPKIRNTIRQQQFESTAARATHQQRTAVQTVSWDNPLREYEVAPVEQQSSFPPDDLPMITPDASNESPATEPKQHTLSVIGQREPREPARIELPEKITPLPPPDSYRDLGSESNFVQRPNPVRHVTGSRIIPTTFHSSDNENPLRTPVGTWNANPLRSTSTGGIER